jgi:hypothetical protein
MENLVVSRQKLMTQLNENEIVLKVSIFSFLVSLFGSTKKFQSLKFLEVVLKSSSDLGSLVGIGIGWK